jgi:periplasmic protein TonB
MEPIQMEHTQKSSRPQALIVAVLFHAMLLIGLYFIMMKLPDPPLDKIGGSGYDINYGLDNAGYGEVQTLNQANESDQNVESAPADVTAANTNTEESNQENQNQTEEQTTVITGNEEVNYEVKDKEAKKSTDVSINKTEKTPNTQTTNTEKAKTNGTTGTAQTTGGNNNGDQPGKTGDQGSKTGTVESKALYGNEGNGGPGNGGVGGNLDIAGWNWDDKPVIKDNTDESGKIVIGFRIDEQGEVIKVWKIENNLSPSVYKLYEDEVRKLTFSKRSDNTKVAAFSEGKVTFIKKSK